MIDTPPSRERFLDASGLAAFGGLAAGVLTLLLATFLRLDEAIDRAADDRVSMALADAPVSAALQVVTVPARTGDWRIADAVLRLDSAGARTVGIAVDLSIPVAPVGGLPELLSVVPQTVIGVEHAGDSTAWPWFLNDSARNINNPRLGLTSLVRDGDGVVRQSLSPSDGALSLADRMAWSLHARIESGLPIGPLRIRFANPDTGWFGTRALPLDTVLAISRERLRKMVARRHVLLGVDDGTTVPTSVGAMPRLAVLAHDIDSRVRVIEGVNYASVTPSTLLRTAWLFAWVLLGTAVAALTPLRVTVALTAVAVVAVVACALTAIELSGVWLPIGMAVVGLLAATLGAEAVRLWQAQRRERLTALLFSRFVTPELAASAWSARHLYLQGGRPAPLQLPVTVLFVDLRGFTRFSEANAPAEVMRLLTDVTAACAKDIADHGGVVDDFAGDGIKADFGIPVPRTTDARIAHDAANAVRCALTLANTIARLVPPGLGRAGVQARIGLHSGVAVAGTVGGGSRLKYTVVGDVVNVAARLQSIELPEDARAATPVRIIVSAATMALLGEAAPTATDLGPLVLTGREQAVHAFRLHGQPRPTN